MIERDDPKLWEVKGRLRTIRYARSANGEYLAHVFLESSDVSEKDKARLYRYFRVLADEGWIRNDEQFKKLTEHLWEFKNHQIRVGTFQVGPVWYLTHGFIKKRDDWRKAEIERGERIREEHIAYLGSGRQLG